MSRVFKSKLLIFSSLLATRAGGHFSSTNSPMVCIASIKYDAEFLLACLFIFFYFFLASACSCNLKAMMAHLIFRWNGTMHAKMLWIMWRSCTKGRKLWISCRTKFYRYTNLVWSYEYIDKLSNIKPKLWEINILTKCFNCFFFSYNENYYYILVTEREEWRYEASFQ